ncbi:SpoIIE family protein phosphatase [Nocardioides sp. SYSU D00038]|uniref:SpoIIE family protein phosphatase n=1 Tax=Nocardioides sp. SYSU D00038 TaxID=2812554 RepID=UPI0019685473|nr:SpoIIE family protein phosphatase [Nocardioides sp. SYSU D00038]
MTASASHTPAYPAVDLSTCDREPIHVPGAIQPHGVLLALDEETHRVVMTSANSGTMLGIEADDALGRTLAEVLGEPVAAQVRDRIEEWAVHEPLVVVLEGGRGGRLAGEEVDVVVHRSGRRIVVELETFGRPRSTLLSYQSARSAMARLSSHATVDDLVAQLAVEVRALTEFDRVMVYRFDRHWNGEVVAEQKRDDLDSFLGLHYPASDIPAQARRLYTLNWTRLIADVDYEPVRLHPVVDDDGAPLDLTHSTLRSVSPIHLEYLGNMGVTASMSVSLVIDDELWGLIACHHYSGSHRPAQDARAAASFLGQVASAQIADRERADAREAALLARDALARVTTRIAASPEQTFEAIVSDPELLRLVGATGVALRYDDAYVTAGAVPDPADVQRIVAAMPDGLDGVPVTTDHLAGLVPELATTPSAAGALVIGSSPERWLVWLRPELVEMVSWGGDPDEKEVALGDDDTVRLSPRRSFDAWREVVRGHSRPWEPWVEDVATGLRAHVNGLLLQRSREQIALAESLQRSVLPPRPPQFPGIDLAVRYLPASEHQLGGDWWDAVAVDDQRLAFVVGDVAGHGVGAAAAMTQVRTALRAYLYGGATTPAALDLLDHLVAEMLGEQVATAVVAVVDRGTRRVELCSAGHPQPLVFGPDGPIDVAVAQRPLLGLGSGTSTGTVVELPPGGSLLLYTDGLVERRGTDLAESLRQLRATAGAGPGDGPLDGWVESVLRGAPGGGDDDTTLLALRFP